MTPTDNKTILIVVGFAVVVAWLAIDTLAAGYFVTLMEKYHISPEPAHAMFVDSIHRYLIWAFAGAIGWANPHRVYAAVGKRHRKPYQNAMVGALLVLPSSEGSVFV
ncbi:MAG: hypothetical protein KFF68_00395 [Desulfosarcina sp.]|nr:hypothetical protein [Desulfosarcina sp.]